MKKVRTQFYPTLKKNIRFVDEYGTLRNGNGPDKVIGESTCSHDCPMKATCKISKISINHFCDF